MLRRRKGSGVNPEIIASSMNSGLMLLSALRVRVKGLWPPISVADCAWGDAMKEAMIDISKGCERVASYLSIPEDAVCS